MSHGKIHEIRAAIRARLNEQNIVEDGIDVNPNLFSAKVLIKRADNIHGHSQHKLLETIEHNNKRWCQEIAKECDLFAFHMDFVLCKKHKSIIHQQPAKGIGQ